MSSISKKPKPTTSLSGQVINTLIQKGGEESKVDKHQVSNIDKIPIQLRLPQNLLDVIDGLLNERVVIIPRHAWFLEAIASKIKKEREES